MMEWIECRFLRVRLVRKEMGTVVINRNCTKKKTSYLMYGTQVEQRTQENCSYIDQGSSRNSGLIGEGES